MSALLDGQELTGAVERFLFAEADTLDRWDLNEWYKLFDKGSMYLVPTTDHPEGDPARDLFLIQDDYFLLGQRVRSLLTKSAHAEWPHSRTRRLITNIRAEVRDDEVQILANFAVYRMRHGHVDCYVGRYEHVVVPVEDSFRFVVRKAVLDLETLRPQGKVSIIL